MADIIQIQAFCMSLPEVVESFPFDETTLVFKVRNKMFALLPLEKELQIMLKCDPDLAEEWRLRFSEVLPAWHMNKKHWNSVLCDEGLSWERIQKMILHSYCMVVRGLPKKDQRELSDLVALVEYVCPQL